MTSNLAQRVAERTTDEELMAEAVKTATLTRRPITDLEARVIAANWNGGPMSELGAFATTGHIGVDLADEVAYVWAHDGQPLELAALSKYVAFYGVRPAVSGWSQLRW